MVRLDDLLFYKEQPDIGLNWQLMQKELKFHSWCYHPSYPWPCNQFDYIICISFSGVCDEPLARVRI